MFGDTAGNQFEPDIEAIAQAGITRGCSATTPPNYCPADSVRRDAMAAFMHRGYGRVALGNLSDTQNFSRGTGQSAIWTYSITAGPPVGALTGATGFVKVDASVSVRNTSMTATCLVNFVLFVDGQRANPVPEGEVLRPGDFNTVSATGAVAVTTPGPHTISVELPVFEAACAGAPAVLDASGESTATYFPFGSTGGSTLSAGAAAQGASPADSWKVLHQK
jgi:hypothetical protein